MPMVCLGGGSGGGGTGPPGPPGTPGAQTIIWFVADETAIVGGLGSDGDYARITEGIREGQWYQKVTGTWVWQAPGGSFTAVDDSAERLGQLNLRVSHVSFQADTNELWEFLGPAGTESIPANWFLLIDFDTGDTNYANNNLDADANHTHQWFQYSQVENFTTGIHTEQFTNAGVTTVLQTQANSALLELTKAGAITTFEITETSAYFQFDNRAGAIESLSATADGFSLVVSATNDFKINTDAGDSGDVWTSQGPDLPPIYAPPQGAIHFVADETGLVGGLGQDNDYARVIEGIREGQWYKKISGTWTFQSPGATFTSVDDSIERLAQLSLLVPHVSFQADTNELWEFLGPAGTESTPANWNLLADFDDTGDDTWIANQTVFHLSGTLALTDVAHNKAEVHLTGTGDLTLDTSVGDDFTALLVNTTAVDRTLTLSGYAGAFIRDGGVIANVQPTVILPANTSNWVSVSVAGATYTLNVHTRGVAGGGGGQTVIHFPGDTPGAGLGNDGDYALVTALADQDDWFEKIGGVWTKTYNRTPGGGTDTWNAHETIRHTAGTPLAITEALHLTKEIHIESTGDLTMLNTAVSDQFSVLLVNTTNADRTLTLTGFGGAFLRDGGTVTDVDPTVPLPANTSSWVTVSDKVGTLSVNVHTIGQAPDTGDTWLGNQTIIHSGAGALDLTDAAHNKAEIHLTGDGDLTIDQDNVSDAFIAMIVNDSTTAKTITLTDSPTDWTGGAFLRDTGAITDIAPTITIPINVSMIISVSNVGGAYSLNAHCCDDVWWKIREDQGSFGAVGATSAVDWTGGFTQSYDLDVALTNVNMPASGAPPSPRLVALEIIQDAGGSNRLEVGSDTALDPNSVWVTGYDIPLNDLPNGKTLLLFYWDGTHYIFVSGAAENAGGGGDATDPLSWKNPARVGEFDVDITVAAPGATIDAVVMAVGDRVLLASQTDRTENGLWVWNGAAVLMTRPSDFAAGFDANNNALFVTEGTHADIAYKQTKIGVVDTLEQTWVPLFDPIPPDASSWKNPVRVIASTNNNVSSPGATVDGVALTLGDRVLLNGQSDPIENGIWQWWGNSTSMVRPPDFPTGGVATSNATIARQGTGADIPYMMVDEAVIDTDSQTWEPFPGSSVDLRKEKQDDDGLTGTGQNIDFDADTADNKYLTVDEDVVFTISTPTRAGEYHVILKTDGLAGGNGYTVTWPANVIGAVPTIVDDGDGIDVQLYYDPINDVFHYFGIQKFPQFQDLGTVNGAQAFVTRLGYHLRLIADGNVTFSLNNDLTEYDSIRIRFTQDGVGGHDCLFDGTTFQVNQAPIVNSNPNKVTSINLQAVGDGTWDAAWVTWP